MRRTLGHIRRRIREELRAEGPDGAGYSDFFIDSNIRSALDALASIYTIRDEVTFTAQVGVNEYDLNSKIDPEVVENIVQVEYKDKIIPFYPMHEVDPVKKEEGDTVYGWVIWGSTLILLGEVEAVDVILRITRAPFPPIEDDDDIEMPYYADEAIVQFVIAACYRESKDYDAASLHYTIYLRAREEVRTRAIPQGRATGQLAVRSEYWLPERGGR